MMILTMTVINISILKINGQCSFLILFVPLLLLIDFYVLSGFRGIKWQFLHKKWFTIIYWIFSILVIVGMLFVTYSKAGFGIRFMLLVLFFLVLLCKISFIPFLFTDDLRRLALCFINRHKKPQTEKQTSSTVYNSIPRSEFLMKAGILAGGVPLAALGVIMKRGLYDYQVKHQKLYLPNLPKSFDGIRIGQISDLHIGNLKNKTAVLGGVEMLMREKTDIIFFTGDLVDAFGYEMADKFSILGKIKAPLGVYSTLGNHDYGDYMNWSSPQEKKKNFDEILSAHKALGWDLLRNENRRLKLNGEEIGILGVENWGAFSWLPKYGRVDLAVKNTDDLPVKLLLSHDPSHWQAQILPKYPQIDVTFSGHTHGMQLGVRTNDFQWSPVQYIFKEWAGIYREGAQQLYVNVGFGFLAVEGRVGILPEITIFELKAASNPSVMKA